MAQFSLSPSVSIKEEDFSAIIPSVATSIGAYAGKFTWGPCFERTTVDSETTLIKLFGKPVDANATDWYSAANYLSYSNFLKLVRVVDSTAKNAVAAGTATQIQNETQFFGTDITTLASNKWLARFPGALGNALEVSMADSATFNTWKYRSVFSSADSGVTTSKTTTVTGTGNTTTGSAVVSNVDVTAGKLVVGQSITMTGFTGTPTIVSIDNSTTITLSAAATANGTGVALSGTISQSITTWAGSPKTSDFVAAAGGSNDELHIVVVDKTGAFTGTKGTILEKWAGLSKAVDAKTADGASSYYREVINRGSQYVYTTAHETLSAGTMGSASTTAFGNLTAAATYTFTGGDDAFAAVTDDDRIAGFALFRDPEVVDVSLVFGGEGSENVADYLIDQIGEYRRDCVVFVSPPMATVVNNAGQEEADIIDFRNKINSSSYAVMDTGWKYQYDRYNDKYRWVPLNADVAGLCASVDTIADPWWSPAGFNRGYIKNVVKLAWNPSSKAQRDNLYQLGINPVATFPGLGTVLYGDKTLQAKPSAFDRINVRRLFIILEKAIATYSKFVLFEFNDAITRTRFINTVTPYLRDIQGRRGIYDFKVLADETVNTPEVIDSNAFVAKILVKPSKSINYIQLNFVAVATGTSFEEIS